MENRKPNDHVDISTSLIENPHLQPDLNQTELDFIQQNAIIDQELQKHDGHLNTWAMCLFKTWMVLSVMQDSVSIPGFTYLVYLDIHNHTKTLARIILELSFILFSCVSLYAMILLWLALRSKDPFKAEKSVSLFKIYLLWSILSVFLYIAVQFYLNSSQPGPDERGMLVRLIPPAINLWTALYVRKVLLKRDPFQQVSSHSN